MKYVCKNCGELNEVIFMEREHLVWSEKEKDYVNPEGVSTLEIRCPFCNELLEEYKVL